jgi:hypothetical protein
MGACDSSNTPGLGLMEDGQVWPRGDLGVLASLIRIIRQDIRTASIFLCVAVESASRHGGSYFRIPGYSFLKNSTALLVRREKL